MIVGLEVAGLVMFVWLSHAVYVQEGSLPGAVCCVCRWSRGTGLHRTSDLIALSLFACASANDFILTVSPMFRAVRSWALGL